MCVCVCVCVCVCSFYSCARLVWAGAIVRLWGGCLCCSVWPGASLRVRHAHLFVCAGVCVRECARQHLARGKDKGDRCLECRFLILSRQSFTSVESEHRVSACIRPHPSFRSRRRLRKHMVASGMGDSMLG